MKTFKEFVSLCEEVEDLGFIATITQQNQDGRIGRDRRLPDSERRRAKPYKPRSDIGTPKPAYKKFQQPTQERGSKDVLARASAAAREERMKAAKARATAKSLE
jgi:hypothetical protein